MGDTSSNPSQGDDGSEGGSRRVERSFTCTVCGYGMTHSVGALRAQVQSTCHNCGDWTVQTADLAELVDTARTVAETLAGEVLTERQALAYLLREIVGVDRQPSAAAMDTTRSNVDNLHRRGREKVADARRIVDELGRLQADSDGAES